MSADIEVRGKRILVTGGAGFIGSHTVDALIDAGADVAIVDDLSTGREQNVNPAARFHRMNIADERFDDVLFQERPEIVYHFAFYVLVPKSVQNPLLDLDGIAGSLRILRRAKDLGIRRIVFASSGFLYGNTTSLPAREGSPVEPVSPYVVSKYSVESYLRFYNRVFGVPFTVLRYAAIYGPRQVTGAMADYIRRLRAGHQADIWGDGTKTRDYVFISDVVDANLLALKVPESHPEPVFNVGTGKETTLNSLYQQIAAIIGTTANPVYHPDRPGEQMRYCLDNSKIRRELGWTPRWSLEDGLRATIEAATH